MNKGELYRDPINGKISGVCAGLANCFGIEVWLVRILVISAALLGGSFLVMLIYVTLTLMVGKQPPNYEETVRSAQDHKLKSKPWQQGQSPEMLLKTIENDFNRLEVQIRDLEAYVTSKRFNFDKEFSKL